MEFLKNILLFIFSWIDSIIAKLITQVYKLLSNLAELVLYNENMIRTIGGRIGLILGIFMLFKLAVSLIDYMISPEKLNDKSKGGSKLIKNVIVSLVLLGTINLIFKEAYIIQGKIVNSRIIEKIFFGNSGMIVINNNNQDNDIKMDIGYYLYSGFLLPNQDIFDDKCDRIWDVEMTNEEFAECSELLKDNVSEDARRSIYNARNSLDMSYVLSDYDLITATPKPRVHAFNYLPLISNASGIIVLLVLISFSMDLATRAIKLLFLQIIAPIPIISYMDMGKGQDIFKKWGKECINTYLSVFIRLIAINFAVFMIVLLRGNYKDVFVNNLWLNVFLIIGALMFAKQVPKLLEDFLGIKLDGMSLKPLKKFQEQALFGKQITAGASGLARGAVGGSLGMLTGAAGAVSGSRENGDAWWKSTLWAFGGAGRGLVGGLGAGAKSKGLIKAGGAGFGQLGSNADYVKSLDNTTLGGRIDAGWKQFWHQSTEADNTKKELETLDNFSKAADSALKRAENEMVKYNRLSLDDGTTIAQHKAMQQQLEILKSQGVSRNDSKYWSGGSIGSGTFNEAAFNSDVEAHAEELRKLQDKINKNQKAFATQYISAVQSGSLVNDSGDRVDDSETRVLLDSIYHYRDELHDKWDINLATGSGAAIKDSKQDAIVAKQYIETEHSHGRSGHEYNLYARQQANAAATKPKGRNN